VPTGKSNTDIANAALIALGEVTINDLTTPTTSLARLVNERFDAVRDAVLRAHNWNTATRRATLATLANMPINEFDTAFAIPDEFIKVLEVMEGDSTLLRYRFEQHNVGSAATPNWKPAILTTSTSVNLRYIARINADAMDVLLYETVAAALAVDLSYKLSTSNAVRETLRARAAETLSEARFADSGERSSDELFLDTWEHARMFDGGEPFHDDTFRFMV
jgi:hypothetical protein